MNLRWYKRSLIPAVQQILRHKRLLFRTRPGDLFCPPAELPELPAEVLQTMTRLLAQMLDEHWRNLSTVARQEMGNG